MRFCLRLARQIDIVMKGSSLVMHSGEWIYGINPVLEALRAGRNVATVYISSGRYDEKTGQVRHAAEKKGIRVETTDPTFFDRRFPKGHQGVAARALQKGYTGLDELLAIPGKKNEPALFVILDGIEDPRNFGAILRSSDAAGVHGVVIQSRRSAGLGTEVAKTSSGAVEYVPVCMVPNIKHAMREMKERGITVVGSEAGDYPALWETDLAGPLALVIGSEGKGARKTVREGCDLMMSIPLKGTVNSLNASVAAGVVLFEILRQRWSKNKKL
jgi:23S rRNA (guanosine2251-2'-O)-methyltransferase